MLEKEIEDDRDDQRLKRQENHEKREQFGEDVRGHKSSF
jgi:hypothetical protein